MPLLADAPIDLDALSASWPRARILREPLCLIDGLFALQPPTSLTSSHSWGIPAFLRHSFALPPTLPSPTPTHLHTIPTLPPLTSTLPPPTSSTLIRYRGLVHDTHSPSYYLGAYLTAPSAGRGQGQAQGQGGQWRTGKYRDVIDLQEGEEVNEASMRTFERMAITLVDVPGESPWVQQAQRGGTEEAAAEAAEALTTPALRGARKRVMEDEVEGADAMDMDGEEGGEAAKRVRTAVEEGKVAAAPSPRGAKGVVVTLYDGDVGSVRVGDVVEVVGVYSFTPHLVGDDDLTPCPSPLHRIHCITYIRTSSTFPLLLSPSDAAPSPLIRTALLSHLTSVCGGDSLTARLLLLAIISKVQSRSDEVVIGKLTLNITRSPPTLLPALAAFAAALLPYSLTLPITLPSLNHAPLYPTKDYDTDTLSPSPLLCPPRTLLLLDETHLTEGELTAVGVNNVRALSALVKEQRLWFDFVWQEVWMPVDVGLVVLSSGGGKGVVGGGATVKVGWKSERVEGGGGVEVGEIEEREWCVWREWVQRVSQGEFGIGKELTSVVEGLFVRRRRADEKVEAEWLHRLLLMARLLALSYGEKQLHKERLNEAVQLVDELAART